MTMKSFLFAVALLLIPATAAPARADALEQALSRGTLRIGVASENFVPWLAGDREGARIGFEIDVATGVADAFGLPAQFVEVPFDQLLESLRDGDVDVVISAMSISAERAREVYFSEPYSATDFTVVVDKSHMPASAAEARYDVEGMKIGVATGTLSESAARQAFARAEIVGFASNGALRDAFLDGSVQGVVAPTPYPDFIVSRDPERYAKEDAPLISTLQAMAVRPDSPRLLNFLNAWVLESRANGMLARMDDYWFGGTEWFDRLEDHDGGNVGDATEEGAPGKK